MSWTVVAKKDVRDAVQSRALWALILVFLLLLITASYAYVHLPEMFGEPGGATFGGLVFFTVGLTGLFVPLAAIVVCYRSLAGERELGSIKLLLSLPTNRYAVFAGKVLGRTLVLVFGLGIGLLGGLGASVLFLGNFEMLATVIFIIVTLGYAAVYATIMVSISALTGSTSRAITLALGFFVVFELFWDVVPTAVLYLVSGLTIPSTIPDWMYLAGQISPSSAYLSSIVALLPGVAESLGTVPSSDGLGAGATVGGPDPFYLQPEVGIVILVLWFIVPFLIGAYRFNIVDL